MPTSSSVDKPVNLTKSRFDDVRPAWSPDGKRIVFASTRHGNRDIFTVDLTGKQLRRLTVDKAFDGSPGWSPDGKRITFVSDRDGDKEIYIMDIDGSNQRRLTRNKGNDISPVWMTVSESSRRRPR